MLIDTHAHLDDSRFAADLPAVLDRSRAANVGAVLAVGTTAFSSAACLRLAEYHPMLRAAAGLHPNHVAESKPGDWDEVVRLTASPLVVAIGETGLDRHWDFTPFPRQEENFAAHLELSRTSGLPLVIHSRECDADMLRMLRAEYDQHGLLCGVMHSFSSGRDVAEDCVAMGLYISFAGMVTYKNAADLRTVAATIPDGRILVETDCPYLTPMPHRGKRNEPAHVALTAACVAQARGVSPDALADLTTRNARTLFSKW